MFLLDTAWPGIPLLLDSCINDILSCLQAPDCLQNQKLSVGIFSSSGIVWICLSCFTDSWANSGAWITFKSVIVWCLISKSKDNSPHFLILKNHVLLPGCLLSRWWWENFRILCYLLKNLLVVFPSGHDFLQLREPVGATGSALFHISLSSQQQWYLFYQCNQHPWWYFLHLCYPAWVMDRQQGMECLSTQLC